MFQADKHLFGMRADETRTRLDGAGLAALLAFIPAAVVGNAVINLPSNRPVYEFVQESSTISRIDPLQIAMNEYPYRARTKLGRRLMQLRQAAIVGGMGLMDADHIEEEIKMRRGELS